MLLKQQNLAMEPKLMGGILSNFMSHILYSCEQFLDQVKNQSNSPFVLFQSMYALMAKCEEVSHGMKPLYQLADQMYPF
jgi:hypothetical protein